MAKYVVLANDNAEGTNGVLDKGGSSRRDDRMVAVIPHGDRLERRIR